MFRHVRTDSLPTSNRSSRSSSPTFPTSRRGRKVIGIGIIAFAGSLLLLSVGYTPGALLIAGTKAASKPVVRRTKQTVLKKAGKSKAKSGPKHQFEPPPNIDENDISTWPAPTPALPDEASLEDRLKAWNSTPVATSAQWTVWSSEALPHSHSYHNLLWGFISPKEDENGPWEGLWRDPARVSRLREEMFEHLRGLERDGMIGGASVGEGRGISIVAGNVDTFKRVRVTAQFLREHLNSTLPVEVVCFPDEMPPEETIESLAKWNVTVRAVTGLARDPSRTKNWHIKSQAIITSPFREVLYLDSDNIPAHDPGAADGLFNSPAFQQLGLFYTPDFWRDTAHNPIWQIIGVQARDEWSQEAGAMLFDKARHLDVLHLSDWMLQHHDLFFHLSDGDKDLFRYATLALRKRWAVPGRHVGAGTWIEGHEQFCGHSMIQHDDQGRAAFVHANMLKKIGADTMKTGERVGQAWGLTRAIDAGFGENGVTSCDEIANAKHDGRGIVTSPSVAVRRRAALERGVRTWFAATPIYAACLSMRWDDPRQDSDEVLSRLISRMEGERSDNDGRFTGSDRDYRTPIVDIKWAEDERLHGFEAAYFRAGGMPTGPGGGLNFD